MESKHVLTFILILTLSASIFVIALYQDKLTLLEKLFMLITTILLHLNIYYVFLRPKFKSDRKRFIEGFDLDTPI